jgi:hypothetical protein
LDQSALSAQLSSATGSAKASIIDANTDTAVGLTDAEAARRLAQFGENALAETHVSVFVKLLSYFWGPIPWMIEVAAVLSALVAHVAYRLLDEQTLSREITDMRMLIDRSAPDLAITQDLGPGMMLWMTQFFPEESWAKIQKTRSLVMLDRMWVQDGYFSREPGVHGFKFAFTNYGVSVGLQAVNAMPERVRRLNLFFDTCRSGDEYDHEAITHVMACSSHFPGYLLRSFG